MKYTNKLTPAQIAILQGRGTEAPYSGALLRENSAGEYLCAGCGAKLFESGTKFDSHCGWPSFDQAISGSVLEKEDTSHGMVRTEVVCARCGGHLGHVFPDGPKNTTGLRYCINSLSLNFIGADGTKKSGDAST